MLAWFVAIVEGWLDLAAVFRTILRLMDYRLELSAVDADIAKTSWPRPVVAAR